MRAVDIICKKRDGDVLSRQEIEYFVRGFTQGEIPDYQVSAWAMAILLKGMNEEEATDLTMAMASSGEVLELSSIGELTVDKHSTGGVGDKTTLVVAPLVAACGLSVGKMSGRGLGFSGGTLDKLEAIPGYRTNLSKDEFLAQLKKIGIVVAGQSADLAPADGKLYSLRDVTGTVPSIPLIASSIMSKKIAAGTQVIVLDVKVGRGAFMKTLQDARSLAGLMVRIGLRCGKKIRAVLSDMNQPLGTTVGNALELKEAIELLRGRGSDDFYRHCIELSAQMLLTAGASGSIEAARQTCLTCLQSGQAKDKFYQWIETQGGDSKALDSLDTLYPTRFKQAILADHDGFIAGMDAQSVGECTVELGAGRTRKTDTIDLAVGIEVFHKVGDFVRKDEPIFLIHANDKAKSESVSSQLKKAIDWASHPVEPYPLFYDIFEK